MTNPFTLEALVAWLETQPADGAYNWPDSNNCLVANYVRAVTGEDEPVGVVIFSSLFPTHQDYFHVGGREPWTYGAALARARALLPAQPPTVQKSMDDALASARERV